jgi:hypothetical protein
MEKAKSFGRRARPSPPSRTVACTAAAEPLAARGEPLLVTLQREPPSVNKSFRDAPPPVEQEIAEWKESPKIRKRSFREPWRSVSIVAGVAFAATSWIVPQEVANVASIGLGVLTAGSIYAGWRGRK